MTRNAFLSFPNLDALFDVSAFDRGGASQTFPFYDLFRVSDVEYQISIAVAGFSRDTIDITVEKDVLTVKGAKSVESDKEQPDYIHKGIARRNFAKQFILGEHYEVESASMEDGILNIRVVKNIPFEKLPKQIPVM
jgi:molecular chaperone IbpA